METLALSLNTTHTSMYLSSRPQTHLIKSPFFPYNTTKYGLCNAKNFNFFTLKVSCKLTKTSKDSVKTKNLIVGPADKAPLLSEKSNGSSESDSQTKPGKKKASGKMLLRRYWKKVLSVLSNLSLAIGEMFTIAGLMAIGICHFVFCMLGLCYEFFMLF